MGSRIAGMWRGARRGSSDIRWLVPALVPLVVAAALALFIFWPRGGPSSDGSAPPPAVSTTAFVPSTTTVSAVTATSTTVPPSTTTSTEPAPVAPLAFDIDLAMDHVRVLAADIGVRRSGTEAEKAAADYAAQYLAGLGYSVEVTEVPLPNGRVSHNVSAQKEGASSRTIAVGAHLDSKAPAPGANDNASGVGLVLELARDLRGADITTSVTFLLFGAEEIVDSNRDHHHYGSRQYMRDMDEDARAVLVGMISADMVAFGDGLLVRNMGRGPQSLTDMILELATTQGLPARYERDPGSSGWSDHEAFELAGYPVAWLEWQDDPTYHTAGDTYDHLDPEVMRQTGQLLRDLLAALTETDLAALAEARQLD